MEWYWLQITDHVGYPQPEDDYAELTYDFQNGCPTCEIGKKQKVPFRFRSEPKSANRQFFALYWVHDEFFVHNVVKTGFRKRRITGVRFTKPVKHRTGEPLESIYQMNVKTVLPRKAVDVSKLMAEKCEMPKDRGMVKFLRAVGCRLEGPWCGRIKYNFPEKGGLCVKRSVLQSQPDIVKTYEWFGSGGAAGRPILVSAKVKRLIEQEQWRGVKLIPVTLK